MTRKWLLVILLTGVVQWMPARALGTVDLASLTNPTLQTLIGMGSSGVISGSMRFYDFSYLGVGTSVPTAGQIAVQATGEDGVRFLSGWSAYNTGFMSGSIGFKVVPVDVNHLMTGLSLLTDNYAVLPGNGAFITVVQSPRNAGNQLIGQPLSTFSDGPGGTPDRTDDASNFITPQALLKLNTSFQLQGNGGLATLSLIETNVVTIPEPTSALAGILLPVVALVRRRAYKPSDW